MSAPTWLKVSEVAQILRVAPMTVYRMVESGDLPAIRFNAKTIRIPIAAMAEFLAASWVGEIPEGYRLEDLLGQQQGDGDVVQLPVREADR